MGARGIASGKPRQMPIQVKIPLADIEDVASFGENFSKLSGDDQLGFAIADDAVAEGFAGFGFSDFPGRAGAALLAFGFSRFDDPVGLTISFGSFPEEFDRSLSAVDEDDGEGAAVRFRGWAGAPAPLQGGQGFQGGFFKGREFFGSERA